MTDRKKPPDGAEGAVPTTGDPDLDRIFARMMANATKNGVVAAAEAEIEAQRRPESALGDSPRGKGRGETGEDGTEPEEVAAETRPTAILPATRLEVTADEADRMAFGGLVPSDGPQRSLPLFPDIDKDGPRVALLEMADRSGVVTMAQGRGAPIPLRLAVGLLLATPYERRGKVARVVTQVSGLRDFLFPNGWKRNRPGRVGDWARTRAGLRTLADCTIPTDPRGGGWFPFRLVHLPGEDAKLSDYLVMDVEGPPGSQSGPMVERDAVARLGLVSGPGFRAYIAAHSVQWVPGRTQRPVPQSPGRYGWSADPDDYEVLTAEDRQRLAFGPAKRNRARTKAELAAPWDVDGVEVVSRRWSCKRTGRRGWLIVPSEAAERVRQTIAARAETEPPT